MVQVSYVPAHNYILYSLILQFEQCSQSVAFRSCYKLSFGAFGSVCEIESTSMMRGLAVL